jgi:hypothetical protein
MKIHQPSNKEVIRKGHCLSRAEIYHLSNEELLGDDYFDWPRPKIFKIIF